jgi:hypothetical protein
LEPGPKAQQQLRRARLLHHRAVCAQPDLIHCVLQMASLRSSRIERNSPGRVRIGLALPWTTTGGRV